MWTIPKCSMLVPSINERTIQWKMVKMWPIVGLVQLNLYADSRLTMHTYLSSLYVVLGRLNCIELCKYAWKYTIIGSKVVIDSRRIENMKKKPRPCAVYFRRTRDNPEIAAKLTTQRQKTYALELHMNVLVHVFRVYAKCHRWIVRLYYDWYAPKAHTRRW